ncbi:MAG: glucose-6-phosphate isomerase [Gammaproteobacteria bacterium]
MTQTRETLHAELTRHADAWRTQRVDEAFAADPQRAARFTREAAGLVLDFSKNRLDAPTLGALCALADAHAVRARIDELFAGIPLNRTEQRAVLHVALRAARGTGPVLDGSDVTQEVHAVRDRMRALVDAVRDGSLRGHSGESIADVVNIGIGGSHLGPLLACEALAERCVAGPRVHFVSNVDGGDIARQLAPLEPARTLFVIASKSFTTPETMLNARTAERWLRDAGVPATALGAHFIAITSRPDRATALGIAPDRVLPMWDWVGGRFSLWSAIGLPIACAIGMAGFEAMLDGAAAMDAHFRAAPWPDNLPVLLALIGEWNTNYLGAETLAVVPYEDRLQQLPAYLQQLEMESNGKRITLANTPVEGHTAPVLWGGVGTNVQHAFFQLLHQGTRLIPVDFILPLTNPRSPPGHHDMLVANCLAQAEALMDGRTAAEVAASSPAIAGIDLPRHRATPGNQPSNLLMFDALTPASLGALLALYEHKTFVQGVLWGINSFDQWGVELGKELAQALLDEMAQGQPAPHHDSSTRAALARYLARRPPAQRGTAKAP